MANKSIYDFSAETLDGQPVPLSNYRGKVLLIVNEVILQLNALMEMYGDLNFTVLGFSCNQFGLQSPEVNHETLNILKYVRPGGGFVPKFPVFGKVEVNGLNEDPLFTYLKVYFHLTVTFISLQCDGICYSKININKTYIRRYSGACGSFCCNGCYYTEWVNW
uniref:Uncharacterized protein n=1 Tax=Amphiprion ocellaris TaxID=80972 RepID=A0AAQ5ZE14_AMPOC